MSKTQRLFKPNCIAIRVREVLFTIKWYLGGYREKSILYWLLGRLWCPDCHKLIIPDIWHEPTDEGSQEIARGADPENVPWEITSVQCHHCGVEFPPRILTEPNRVIGWLRQEGGL